MTISFRRRRLRGQDAFAHPGDGLVERLAFGDIAAKCAHHGCAELCGQLDTAFEFFLVVCALDSGPVM